MGEDLVLRTLFTIVLLIAFWTPL